MPPLALPSVCYALQDASMAGAGCSHAEDPRFLAVHLGGIEQLKASVAQDAALSATCRVMHRGHLKRDLGTLASDISDSL